MQSLEKILSNLMNWVSMENTQFISQQKLLFFDNCFIRRLWEGAFTNALVSRQTDLWKAIEPPFKAFRTPFSFMEWIGIEKKNLKNVPSFVKPWKPGGDWILDAFKHYRSHFDSLEDLNIERITERFSTQRNCVAPIFMDVWDAVFSRILDGTKNESDWLRFALAFDAVQKIDVGRKNTHGYVSDLMSSFSGDETRGFSKFRLAVSFWKSKRDISDNQDEWRKTWALVRLKNSEDYLDCDLVHAATFGGHGELDRFPLICITCDRSDVVRTRIMVYKFFFKLMRTVGIQCSDSDEEKFNGEVLCFDKSGNLADHIDVAKVEAGLLIS
jgi:hypothetical protein